jgi:mannose-6-phosphate isomerase
VKLHRSYVEKPWGRTRLPPMFDPPPGQRIGEVWYTNGTDLPLLAKYIFTSERLSIQVHPDDEQARARGLPRGKTECWCILEAEPDATLGIGLKRETTADALRQSALDGSIVDLLDWRPVRAGDFFFVPSGTVHAIGGGVSLLEFQQNSDVTYRLYDYGRPRELHLDDAVAVSRPAPYPGELAQHLSADEQRTLVDGPHFILVQTCRDSLRGRRRWVMPLDGIVRSGSDTAEAGEILLLEPEEELTAEGGQMLVGATAAPSSPGP